MAARNPLPFTPDALLAITERLALTSADLKVVIDGMKERKIEKIDVVNAIEMKKGLDKLDGFARAAIQAYHEHRMDNSPEGSPRKKR